jgi:hypothetical protein
MTRNFVDRFARISRGSATRYTHQVCCAALLLGFPISFSLGACHAARRHTPVSSTVKPVLSAEPNPVPAGDPDQPLASTTLTWDTGGEMTGDVYVKVNRSSEVLVAQARSGTLKIEWIQFDSTYEFRLYANKHSKLLAKVDVTRDN